MPRWWRRLLLCLCAGSLAAPAAAAWQEASSDHFLIYADAEEPWLRGFAETLERFDGALRLMRPVAEDEGFRSNRLTIYVVADAGAVQRLCGCNNAAGFYVPRAGGSIAYTPRRAGTARWDLGAQQVLLHEYSHHFLFRNFAAAYPAWFSEGFAEFHATATFAEDGSVSVGQAPLYRGYNILFGRNVLSARALFDPATRMDAMQVDALYARGWLLTHYLLNNAERAPSLDNYLRLVNGGTPSVAAAEQAFGELTELDRALQRYVREKLHYWTVRGAAVKPGPIAIRPLGPGAAATMAVRMQSDRGVDARRAHTIVAAARKAAAPFPFDPAAQGVLAEAEFDAGELDAALAAAERALSADPANVQALLYRGRVLAVRAAQARNDAAAWKAARAAFIRANAVDPNMAEPLILYYRTYPASGTTPTQNAKDALRRAFVLAPEDRGLRWLVARHYLDDDEAKSAREVLAPLAFDPHARAADNPAARALALIDAGKSGQEVSAALGSGNDEDDGGS